MCDTERERESAKPNRCVLTQQRTATHCNKHTATHLHKMYISTSDTPTHLWETHLCVTARHCNTLQHTLQHTHCNILQHTATHCTSLNPKPEILQPVHGNHDTPVCHNNALQHTATHTLQHTVRHDTPVCHCNTLQHKHCNSRACVCGTATHCNINTATHVSVSVSV